MSNSNAARLISLLPFGYYAVTRLRSFRDVSYLVVTSWAPVVLIAWGGGGLSLSSCLLSFSAGYLAFISIYEIGYLVNDAWDSWRHTDGRARAIERLGKPTMVWLMAFVVIRIAAWVGVSIGTGWWHSAPWIAGHAILVVVFLAHNWLGVAPLRLATFSQLAILRYMLPLTAVIDERTLVAQFVAAVLAYLPLRYLSYADSKGLLALPTRRSPWFAAGYLALTLPLLSLAAWLLNFPALVGVGLFLAAAHAAWGVGSRQVNGAN